ncbi:atp3 gamma subunit of the F1 sector of mitochondrial F1F0 ATP synthase, partial [Cladochytrium tenue]
MFAAATFRAAAPRAAAAAAAPASATSVVLVAPARGYATLKEIQMRLKSISNIEKITKSMKMIASTKVSKAQRNMETARVYGNAAIALYKYTEPAEPETSKRMMVAVSSDRGLCGGIHSSISKNVRRNVAESSPEAPIAILGQKARNQIQRDLRPNIVVTFDQVTKNFPTWLEASVIAGELINAAPAAGTSGYTVFYNKFKSVIAFETTPMPVYSFEAIKESPKILAYEVDDDVLKNYEEFTFANALYWAISEGYASEMAAKRSAMENATKNAGEMIQKLTLTYN